MSDTMGGNSQAEVRAIVARLEDIERRKAAAREDRKVIMADAKAKGFKPAYLSYVVRQRAKKPEEYAEQESTKALYEHAVGLKPEPPLFRQLDAMASDATSRDRIIDFFKKLVPANGEIIAKVGDKPMRIWRDRDGKPQAEEWKEPSFDEPAKTPTLPPRAEADVPDWTPGEAERMGAEYAKQNRPITDNPFPFGDPRQERFETGWKNQTGNDGTGEDGDD